jgi:hypothetical protein
MSNVNRSFMAQAHQCGADWPGHYRCAPRSFRSHNSLITQSFENSQKLVFCRTLVVDTGIRYQGRDIGSEFGDADAVINSKARRALSPSPAKQVQNFENKFKT